MRTTRQPSFFQAQSDLIEYKFVEEIPKKYDHLANDLLNQLVMQRSKIVKKFGFPGVAIEVIKDKNVYLNFKALPQEYQRKIITSLQGSPEKIDLMRAGLIWSFLPTNLKKTLLIRLGNSIHEDLSFQDTLFKFKALRHITRICVENLEDNNLPEFMDYLKKLFFALQQYRANYFRTDILVSFVEILPFIKKVNPAFFDDSYSFLYHEVVDQPWSVFDNTWKLSCASQLAKLVTIGPSNDKKLNINILEFLKNDIYSGVNIIQKFTDHRELRDIISQFFILLNKQEQTKFVSELCKAAKESKEILRILATIIINNENNLDKEILSSILDVLINTELNSLDNDIFCSALAICIDLNPEAIMQKLIQAIKMKDISNSSQFLNKLLTHFNLPKYKNLRDELINYFINEYTEISLSHTKESLEVLSPILTEVERKKIANIFLKDCANLSTYLFCPQLLKMVFHYFENDFVYNVISRLADLSFTVSNYTLSNLAEILGYFEKKLLISDDITNLNDVKMKVILHLLKKEDIKLLNQFVNEISLTNKLRWDIVNSLLPSLNIPSIKQDVENALYDVFKTMETDQQTILLEKMNKTNNCEWCCARMQEYCQTLELIKEIPEFAKSESLAKIVRSYI